MLDDGIPRWFGKQFHNELVNMPFGEQRRIIEILTQKTKRTALKECLVLGNHKGRIIKGHSVQEAVMCRLALNSKVIAFSSVPIMTNRSRQFPCKTPISQALTGFFTCKEHEELFFEVERQQPDFKNERHLDLLAYKGLVKALWDKKLLKDAWSAVAAEDDESDMPDFQVRLFTEMERGLGDLKQLAEIKLRLLGAQPSGKKTVSDLTHHIVRVPSERRSFAMSSWSNGLVRKTTPTPYGPVHILIPQWGCTVYPLEKEHIVMFHYFSRDRSQFSQTMKSIRTAKTPAILQRRITQLLLSRFEDLVMSPKVWESFPEQRRNAICDYFRVTTPDIGIESPIIPLKPFEEWGRRRRRLVNLFAS